MKEILLKCWQTQLKLLSFRLSTEQLLSLGENEFYWGLFWVWLAGVGRAWDDPHAEIFKKSGLPSVIYIFVLALFLWIFIAPLKPANWSLKRLIV
ncbi:MAG: hypothetical protein K2X81_28785, partial [Candidatus Obscuribacterales bacterium]|nr:hypothetical protein [Candidatus Obscuribacterales bacterium]